MLFDADDTKKSGMRLVGDVEFEEARKRSSWITPVPGIHFLQVFHVHLF